LNTGSRDIHAAAELAEARRSFDQGRFDIATGICNRVLTRDPDNVAALNILGGSLARTGKLSEAIIAAERVCLLSPGNAAFISNLSYLYSVVGNFPKAVLALARAITLDSKIPAYQTNFARLVDNLEFYQATAETAVIKEAIRICLGNPDMDLGSFATSWHSLLLLDPAFIKFGTFAQNGDFTDQAETVRVEELADPLTDQFFLLGLKSLHAIDVRLEQILTFFRHFFISRLDHCDPALFLPFLCALAEHCHLNEYVYGRSDEEQRLVADLETTLDRAGDMDPKVMLQLALLACYQAPDQAGRAELFTRAGSSQAPEPFGHLLEITLASPARTRACEDTVSRLPEPTDTVEHSVSATVARQYEENPYPRWRHLEIPVLNAGQRAMGRGRRILVAGCGTGYEPLNMAVLYPEAEILGVDLSVPSLAYGKQKATEYGIRNIEFLRADILDLDQLGQQFDLISSVGVLHHMQDPVQGWRRLVTCLKPGGFMKIGLYSELARQSVIACRNWVKERGFRATPEGIRQFRQAIIELDTTSPLKDITTWTDFYSLSMCRDLVFHVQEHNLSLPRIKSILDELALQLLSMRISNPHFRHEYLSMHPDDPSLCNLDYLHGYEMHNPRTFRDMYHFWCCPRGSATAHRPPEWFYTSELL
jgi:2-polyprenyl-3-methyl-5-hydroxy-6-metoxy-1,4-benzoquinol methylase/tetratricopeptide (TPR) repeat protein